MEYYEQYLELTRNINDTEGEAKACHYLGFAHYSLKELDKAIEYHNRDLSLSKEIQDRVNMGRAYCNLGMDCSDCSVCLLTSFTTSLTTSLIDLNRQLCLFALATGLAHSALGNYMEALECQKNYLCTCQEDSSNKMRALSNIGDVLTKMKKFDEAIKIFEKQVSIARSVGDVLNEANAFAALTICQKQADNFEKASLSDTASQSKETKVSLLENIGRNSAFSIYQGRGEPEGEQNDAAKTSPITSINSSYAPSVGVYGQTKIKTAEVISAISADVSHIASTAHSSRLSVKSMSTNRSDASSTTGSVLDWESSGQSQSAGHRRSGEYQTRKQLQLSLKKMREIDVNS